MTKEEPNAATLELEMEEVGLEEGAGPIASPDGSVDKRNPVLFLLLFAAFGMGLGLALSMWHPENAQYKAVALLWIGLVGDMFIRALKAVVLPLVFANVILSVVDMMSVGRASTIGFQAVGLYLVTTLIASILGLGSILCFQGLVEERSIDETPISYGKILLGCEEQGSFVSQTEEGGLFCNSSNITDSANFYLKDVDHMFVTKSTGLKNDMTVSDTIYEGVFRKLIPSNVFESFVEANFAAVVLFAFCVGTALSKIMQENGISEGQSHFLAFLKEVELILLRIISWIMTITPLAVMSLIANAVGQQENLHEAFQDVGVLVVATIVAMVAHILLVYLGLYALLTKTNPISYLKHFLPAQATAFACASSAATIPVTMQCAKKTELVPDSIAKFVLPLGSTINMDGGAIYFPCACIWLARLNGLSPSFSDYFMLILLATLGSMGTAPVPSASLVLIITTFNTIWGTGGGTPDGFSLILAIDWLMDRCRTVVNITGDSIVTGLVAHLVATRKDRAQQQRRSVIYRNIDDTTGAETTIPVE